MKIKFLIIGVALLGVALSVFLLNAKVFEKISAEDAFQKGIEFFNQEN